MSKKLGRSTILTENKPSIIAYASVVGKKEGDGPLGAYFDVIHEDTTLGELTWEKSESRIQKDTLNLCLQKAGLSTMDLDLLIAGDLLNQCISSTYGLREMDVPFYGVYGACSTMAESLGLAALLVDNGPFNYISAVTSSHFCSAERQFRLPLEYGGQRTPSNQWTVTGGGALIVGKNEKSPFIKAVSIGRIKDLGIKDANNMGAAMAPAAAQTIKTFFEDTNTSAEDYELIVTGDLGHVGTTLLYEILLRDNINIASRHNDCGKLIFDKNSQDVHSGGSGCGCSASVLCSYLLKNMEQGNIKNMLFVATGALMSTTSVQQGESIPGIAHLVHITSE